jgi:hypothetical protein
LAKSARLGLSVRKSVDTSDDFDLPALPRL